MEFIPTEISDVILIKPDVYGDNRGFFFESYRQHHFIDNGLDIDFVQDNISLSQKGALRGLHYQVINPQDKLVMALTGCIMDVAVDLRKSSPSFGKHTSRILSEENKHQLFIPKGFAHGFLVLSAETLVHYKCSDYYNSDGERGLLWNDPVLNIDWQIKDPILSDKDLSQPNFDEIPTIDLFS